MDYVTRQFINLAKHFRKDLRVALSALTNALQKQTEAIRDSHQVGNDKSSPPREVVAVRDLPTSIEIRHNEDDTNAERNYRRFMFLVTTLTLGAIAIYAALVYWQYQEMIAARQQAQTAIGLALTQFDLTKQQMIRTQAAALAPLLSMTIQPNGIEETRLQIELMNNGHERADNAIAKVTVVEHAVATAAPIGKPLAVTVTSPYGLSPIQDLDTLRRLGRGVNNSYSETFTVPLTDKLLKMIENADVAVEARGTITYNDGFRDTSESFCLTYINYSSIKRHSFPYNFVDCRDFKSALASAVDARNFDQQGK